MSTTTQTRRCAGTNKAGEPCKAPPLKGGDLCSVHDPDSPTSAEFAPGHSGKGGRPRIPRQTELAVKEITERLSEPIQVIFDALGAVKADGSPHWATRLAAAEVLVDRALGKAPQKTELTGANGGPVSIAQVWAGASLDGAFSLN